MKLSMKLRWFAVPAALAASVGLMTSACDGGYVCSFSTPLPDDDPTLYLVGAYLWVGPPDVAPPCPPGAPDELFVAYADLGAVPHTCPACACGPSETTCTGPTTWNAVAASCNGAANAPKTGFNAPADWNGLCSTGAKIEADEACAGGVPCAQAVMVEPPLAVGAPCTPMMAAEEPKPGPPLPWGTFARGCAKDLTRQKCGDEPKSTGSFQNCLRLESAGDECPGDYSLRYELFQGASDERTCAACTCGPPQGGECAVKVGAFSDEACQSPAGSAYVTSDGPPVCFDVPDGTALLGKNAEPALSSPGTCAPGGGEPLGQVAPAQPVTWCCYVRPKDK